MPITQAEQEQRQRAVAFARASVALEGFVLPPAGEALFRRYVAGEISRSNLKVRPAYSPSQAKPGGGSSTSSGVSKGHGRRP